MPNPDDKQDLAKNVRAMYNAHPFPNRETSLSSRSDERFEYIYSQFLRIPTHELEGKTILDAGCGTGENTWSWRRILPESARVIAVDHARASISIANTQYPDMALRPDFSVGSLLDLGLATNSIDLVFCSGVLVAVTEPYRAYQELVRVLKPGGYMILILYHRYGRAIHGFRRAVVDLLEKDDIDRRARLGGKLFRGSMEKFAREERVPLEGILYDQFGLPCESRYSVGQVLRWFKQANISYLGTWPPVEWSQFGKAVRFSNKLAQHRQNNSMLYKLLTGIFPEPRQSANIAPNLVTRLSMETMWFFEQLQLFAISGRKE